MDPNSGFRQTRQLTDLAWRLALDMTQQQDVPLPARKRVNRAHQLPPALAPEQRLLGAQTWRLGEVNR
jgi:hypothetical protein